MESILFRVSLCIICNIDAMYLMFHLLEVEKLGVTYGLQDPNLDQQLQPPQQQQQQLHQSIDDSLNNDDNQQQEQQQSQSLNDNNDIVA